MIVELHGAEIAGSIISSDYVEQSVVSHHTCNKMVTMTQIYMTYTIDAHPIFIDVKPYTNVTPMVLRWRCFLDNNCLTSTVGLHQVSVFKSLLFHSQSWTSSLNHIYLVAAIWLALIIMSAFVRSCHNKWVTRILYHTSKHSYPE